MFIETRLLEEVAYGSQFGKEYKTRIVTLRSGVDRRNAEWSAPLGRYSVMFDTLKPEDHQIVVNAHAACMGSLVGFRFKDWSDYQAVDEIIGTGIGSEQSLQLIKTYRFGGLSYVREIKKPVDGSVIVYADDVQISSTLNPTTGVVTFTAPSQAIITWSGEFDVPVRFDNDRLDVEPVGFAGGGHYLSTDVELTEIRL